MNYSTISPKTLAEWLATEWLATERLATERLATDDAVMLVDVRQEFEHRNAFIEGSLLLPLHEFCYSKLDFNKKKIVIYCQQGMRGKAACEKLLKDAKNDNKTIEVYNLEGGIEAWQSDGLAVISHGKNIVPLNQQVQLAIGTLVLFFLGLSFWVNPLFNLAIVFIASGLVFAGLSGTCGMARVIEKMPWNKVV